MINTNELINSIYNNGLSKHLAQEYLEDALKRMIRETLSSPKGQVICLDSEKMIDLLFEEPWIKFWGK